MSSKVIRWGKFYARLGSKLRWRGRGRATRSAGNHTSKKVGALSVSSALVACLLPATVSGPRHASSASLNQNGPALVPGVAYPRAINAAAANPASPRKAGDLDGTFGHQGQLNIDFGGGSDEVYGSALQPDGRVVLVGEGYPHKDSGVGSFSLVRLTKAGALDTTFGSGGKVSANFVQGKPAGARAVVLLPDGKLLVAGYSYNASYYHTTFAVARYNANGTLDAAFGTGGVTLTPIEQGTGGNGPQDTATALALDARNNIVVAGYTGFILDDFAAARLTPDGKLDTTFGKDGIYRQNISSDDRAAVVAIQPDGKIVIAGSANGPDEDFAMVRLRTDGTPDASFGKNGIVTTDFIHGSDRASGIVLLPNGKIVLGGTGQLPSPYGTHIFGTALARYNVNGALDTTWGTGGSGKQLWSIGNCNCTAWGMGLVRLADGRLVQTGSYLNNAILVNVYNADGTFDKHFGGGDGAVAYNFSKGFSRGNTVLVQPDGKIVAAGRAVPRSDDQLAADFGVIRIVGPSVASAR